MCSLTISRSLFNFKVVGQRSRSHAFLYVFRLHDTAATHRKYLDLRKAWQSSFC